ERIGRADGAPTSPDIPVLPTAEKTGKLDVTFNANLVEILQEGTKTTRVKYVNTQTGEEYIKTAEAIVLTRFILNNAKLLMTSDIGEQYDPETGKGTLGKNYCYQIEPEASGFFDEQMNTFMGAGALGMTIDDFNGDSFDHSDLDFIHGSSITFLQSGSRPIG